MKKTIKIILIIIFFICFLGLFFRPQIAKADFKEDAYNAITTYRDFIQGGQNAILSQFFTYSYIGIGYYSYGSGVISNRYNLNLVVTDISVSSSGAVTYTCGTGSYYYSSSDGFSVPHVFSTSITIYTYNGVARYFRFQGHDVWFFEPSFSDYVVTYCDLSDGYYLNSHDGTSLQHVDLFTFPSSSLYGTISTPSSGDTFGVSIDKSIEIVSPAPVVTTLPPFQPPATLPPVTLPPVETVTALPVLTDDSNNYYIDYSPYIDANFYSPPTTEDISLSPALSASGAIISEGFGWLSDSGMFSVLLVLMLVSFAIYNLI